MIDADIDVKLDALTDPGPRRSVAALDANLDALTDRERRRSPKQLAVADRTGLAQRAAYRGLKEIR